MECERYFKGLALGGGRGQMVGNVYVFVRKLTHDSVLVIAYIYIYICLEFYSNNCVLFTI